MMGCLVTSRDEVQVLRSRGLIGTHASRYVLCTCTASSI